MSTRFKVYHVLHSEEHKGWRIEIENSRNNTGIYRTKKEAVASAKAMAKCQVVGHVIIHRMDGTIQREHTYTREPHKYHP